MFYHVQARQAKVSTVLAAAINFSPIPIPAQLVSNTSVRIAVSVSKEVTYMPEAAQPTTSSPSAPASTALRSANLVAEPLLNNRLGFDTGQSSSDDDVVSLEDQLPVSQRFSPVMVAAHASVERQFGAQLPALTLAELQALQTRLTLQEKHLLTTTDRSELFSDMPPHQYGHDEAAAEKTDQTPPDSSGLASEGSAPQSDKENETRQERLSPRVRADSTGKLRSFRSRVRARYC